MILARFIALVNAITLAVYQAILWIIVNTIWVISIWGCILIRTGNCVIDSLYNIYSMVFAVVLTLILPVVYWRKLSVWANKKIEEDDKLHSDTPIGKFNRGAK